MGTPSILISGASIAGPACASWLAAAGWEVTVVERSHQLREEGQNVDVQGVGREVVRRMGLEQAVAAHHTTETGMAFVDDGGGVWASFPRSAPSGSATAELEILRGQLACLLYEHSAGAADYRFGDQIVELHDDGGGVDVTFARGPARRFDAVVIAEGARSRTRDRVFADARIDELGLLAAYCTIPRTAGDDDRWRIHVGGRGRLVHLRPDAVGSTRAMLSLATGVRGLDRLGRDDVVAVLRSTFGDLGWETPRILAGLDDPSLHVDQIAQVRLPSWHRGRVAVVGDAAWCAGPFGTGTSSALAGAYVLAGELGATPGDVPGAFARYEGVLRPMVDLAQGFVPGGAHPRTPRQVARVRAALRVMSGPLGRAASRVRPIVPAPPVDTITLPDYPSRVPVPS